VASKQTEFNLLITEIFRRENGEWKLVHRHADPLTNPPSKDLKPRPLRDIESSPVPGLRHVARREQPLGNAQTLQLNRSR
jgi:hypothetical protein